jgi:hypothetical protein
MTCLDLLSLVDVHLKMAPLLAGMEYDPKDLELPDGNPRWPGVDDLAQA